MEYFPFFFDLKQRSVLIVGGGEIATRKARLVRRAGAVIHVVSTEIDAELQTLITESGGKAVTRAYCGDMIHGYVLVIAATDDDVVNAQVSADCQAICIPVNVVDSPKECTVITPAIVDRSPIVIAVSSGGEAPVLARMVKSILEYTIPSTYGRLGAFAARFRDTVKAALPNIELRRRFWESTLAGDIADDVMAGNADKAEVKLLARLKAEDVHTLGEVYLVGAGPGDPDLLTFKALRLMQRAEVVLYDRLVTKPILDMVRKDADFIYVGKRRSEHAVPQQTINELLLQHAQQGKRVLRLKGGDPFIFGRGAEEIDLLSQHRIPFQVVPGITAASGCASYAGIPLTHRDYSQSVRFVTGHVKEGVLDFRWQEFVEDSQTLVFYMGLTGLSKICQQLIYHGKSDQTPAALVERGTQPEQRVHIGTLASLPAIVQQQDIRPPTLLIIGGVVALHDQLKWFKSD